MGIRKPERSFKSSAQLIKRKSGPKKCHLPRSICIKISCAGQSAVLYYLMVGLTPEVMSEWMASGSTPPGSTSAWAPRANKCTGGCRGDAEGRNASENSMDHRAGFLSVHLLDARWSVCTSARRCHLWPPGLFLPGIPLGAQQQGHPILPSSFSLSLSLTISAAAHTQREVAVSFSDRWDASLSVHHSLLIAFSG